MEKYQDLINLIDNLFSRLSKNEQIKLIAESPVLHAIYVTGAKDYQEHCMQHTPKIESWRLDIDDPVEKWEGEVISILNEYDLNIIVHALSTAEYEGTISPAEQGHVLNKLNIEL